MNLLHGPLCRHDHRLKHEGGRRLRQPMPGHFWVDQTAGPDLPRPPPPITTELPGRCPDPSSIRPMRHRSPSTSTGQSCTDTTQA